MCLLSMISLSFPEQKLRYNPAKMAFDNCKEADAQIKSLYAYNKEFIADSSFFSKIFG